MANQPIRDRDFVTFQPISQSDRSVGAEAGGFDLLSFQAWWSLDQGILIDWLLWACAVQPSSQGPCYYMEDCLDYDFIMPSIAIMAN